MQHSSTETFVTVTDACCHALSRRKWLMLRVTHESEELTNSLPLDLYIPITMHTFMPSFTRSVHELSANFFSPSIM